MTPREIVQRFVLVLPALLLVHPLFADDSDSVMPEIVARSKSTVEVLFKFTKPTGDEFPDASARVRMVDGIVQLADLALYPGREADLSEGLVAFTPGLRWGACDRNGKVVIQPDYDAAFHFSSGLAGVSKDGLYGFIDKKGRWVIKPAFDTDFTWDFVGEVCPVRIGGKNAVINKKGQYVWQPGLLRAENLGGGIHIQTADQREGFLDDQGALIPKGEPNRRYYKGPY